MKQSDNFEFLRANNEALANLGGLAEAVLFVDPGSALTRLRSFAEEIVKAIYEKEGLPRLPMANFHDLLTHPVFESCVNKSLIYQLNSLRIQGNGTAHGEEGSLRNAQVALGTAHQLGYYMSMKYYGGKLEQLPSFIEIQNPTAALNELQKANTLKDKQIAQQREALEKAIEQLERERVKVAEKATEPSTADQAQKKAESQKVADSLQWSEAKTRALLIYVMLA